MVASAAPNPAARKPARSNRLRVSTTSSSWIRSRRASARLALGDRVAAGHDHVVAGHGARGRAGRGRGPRPGRRDRRPGGRCRHGRTGSGTGADGACARRAPLSRRRAVARRPCGRRRCDAAGAWSLLGSHRTPESYPLCGRLIRERRSEGGQVLLVTRRGRPRGRPPRSDDPPRCVRTTGPAAARPRRAPPRPGAPTRVPRRGPRRRRARPRPGAGRCRWTRRTRAPRGARRRGDAHHVGHGARRPIAPGPRPRPRRRRTSRRDATGTHTSRPPTPSVLTPPDRPR